MRVTNSTHYGKKAINAAENTNWEIVTGEIQKERTQQYA